MGHKLSTNTSIVTFHFPSYLSKLRFTKTEGELHWKKNCFAHCWGPNLSWENLFFSSKHCIKLASTLCLWCDVHYKKSNCWLSPQKLNKETFFRTWLVKFSTLFERVAIVGYLKWTPNNRAALLPALSYKYFGISEYINIASQRGN